MFRNAESEMLAPMKQLEEHDVEFHHNFVLNAEYTVLVISGCFGDQVNNCMSTMGIIFESIII